MNARPSVRPPISQPARCSQILYYFEFIRKIKKMNVRPSVRQNNSKSKIERPPARWPSVNRTLNVRWTSVVRTFGETRCSVRPPGRPSVRPGRKVAEPGCSDTNNRYHLFKRIGNTVVAMKSIFFLLFHHSRNATHMKITTNRVVNVTCDGCHQTMLLLFLTYSFFHPVFGVYP